MNRLILVGNGFDLAHGLKTSYCHFMSYYLSKALTTFLHNMTYSDPLVDINWKDQNSRYVRYESISQEESLNTFKSLLENPNFTVQIKSPLLSETLDKIRAFNWVDLENEYFENLIKCNGMEGFDFEKVKKLNKEFEFIKTELEKYLAQHQNEFFNTYSYVDKCSKIFHEKINKSDLAIVDLQEDELPKNLLILSFNYTYTLDSFKAKCSSVIPTQLNYIHGELNSDENPIIFGFGDEYDKNYLDFEELKNKDILSHIKSFSYFKTSNYHNLLRFIESEEFQVYIFGHSCGLSDRTMLKHIFEHEKCKSIKIFYHERSETENDFTDKTYDISRHFSDKGSMRKKLVPFEKSTPMPQARIFQQ